MKKAVHIFFLLGGFISLFGQFPHKNFEIVESIPLETNLDNAEIRNTPEVWLEMIRNAKKTIDMEEFYLSNKEGSALEQVIQTIEKQAKNGVKVRIIAESKMSKTYPKTIKRLDSLPNITVRILKAFDENHGINHSKYFIIDQERVFIGSQNFDWRALEHIHELGFNIRSKAFATTITELFELDWIQAESNELIKTIKVGKKTNYPVDIGEETVQFYPTASPYHNMPYEFYADEMAIVEAINTAENSVNIQLLSYSPSTYDDYYGTLDNTLRAAALRGVKVNLLVSDWCQKDHEIPYLKSLQLLPNIDVKHSTIPEFSKYYIPFARVEHCKIMTVDDTVSWLGTSNWKKDYFYNSRNLGVIVNSQTITQKLSDIFFKSWNSNYTSLVDINKAYAPKNYGEK